MNTPLHQVLCSSSSGEGDLAQSPTQQQQHEQPQKHHDSLQPQQDNLQPPQPHNTDQQQEQQLQLVRQALEVLQAQAEVLYVWDDWKSFFAEQDADKSLLDSHCSDLEAAVAAEDYAAAADRKSHLLELVSEDPVAAVRAQMQSALAAEDYKQLGRLQDEGWAWLEGWWATEDGQLLRVAPE